MRCMHIRRSLETACGIATPVARSTAASSDSVPSLTYSWSRWRVDGRRLYVP